MLFLNRLFIFDKKGLFDTILLAALEMLRLLVASLSILKKPFFSFLRFTTLFLFGVTPQRV
jgi:hypothetical protein